MRRPSCARPELKRLNLDINFDTGNVGHLVPDPEDRTKARWDTTNVRPGYTLKARLVDLSGSVVADEPEGRSARAEDATVEPARLRIKTRSL